MIFHSRFRRKRQRTTGGATGGFGLTEEKGRRKKLGMKLGFRLCGASFCFLPVAGFILLFPLILLGWPLDGLEIRRVNSGSLITSEIVFCTPVLLGRGMTNTIIHSVQLTPVIDEYRIQEGRIWAWQEKILSHNAGLPSLKPEHGRFVFDPPWMIVEGTRQSWDHLYYRVGTEEFGKNILCISSYPCHNLWKDERGKRLQFRSIYTTIFHGYL